jgi:hypothetical protein
VFRTPNSGLQVKQNEKSIAVSLGISNDEQDIKEENKDDKKLSLPLHRYIQNI